ncbi:hypothetical protein RDI58_024277 [Solanum bulbocastanum]|uniref:Uncharacterized protein n=1 Tax=Solanum bulbocastanum TaxID=147425 RepID=A0AAN8T0R6_SOLBU
MTQMTCQEVTSLKSDTLDVTSLKSDTLGCHLPKKWHIDTSLWITTFFKSNTHEIRSSSLSNKPKRT